MPGQELTAWGGGGGGVQLKVSSPFGLKKVLILSDPLASTAPRCHV